MSHHHRTEPSHSDPESPRRVATDDSVRLSDGALAQIVPDRIDAGAFELLVDGTPQSHIDLKDPSRLYFDYVRRMGFVVDSLAPAGDPITVLHLGAGALTLPRYIAATRPGSRQQVVELERPLVDLVRRRLPLPAGASVRVRYGDAREVVHRLPHGLEGAVDAIVVDVFQGAQTPAHLTTAEFHRELARFLSPHGLVLVNVADGRGQHFVRSQAATLLHVYRDLIVTGESGVMKGRRFGNIVLVASPASLDPAIARALHTGGPHPVTVLTGGDAVRFAASGSIVTDTTAVPSPEPPSGLFG